MAFTPRGTKFYIASAFGSALPTTVATNATECVVTSTAHGLLSNGDIVEVTSGWPGLNLRAARVKSVATNTFVLEGFNTSNTARYPAGAGIGSVRKVTTFVQIPGVVNAQSSGGDPRNITYSFYEEDIDRSINDGFNASVLTVTIDADQFGTAGYTALASLTDVQTNSIFYQLLKNGGSIYQPCTVALNETPQIQTGQIATNVFTVNGNNRPTRY
jgi:hypothetical protein